MEVIGKVNSSWTLPFSNSTKRRTVRENLSGKVWHGV